MNRKEAFALARVRWPHCVAVELAPPRAFGRAWKVLGRSMTPAGVLTHGIGWISRTGQTVGVNIAQECESWPTSPLL